MTTKLTLTGKSDGAELNEDGVLVVPEGSAVLLTVSSDSDLDPTELTLSRDGGDLPDTFTAADGKSATATVSTAGAYQVTHTDGSKSNEFTISAQAANEGGDGGGGGEGGEPTAVVETGFGILDRPFLWATFLAALVGVAVVIVLFARQVRFLNNLTSAWSEASFALRSAAEIQWAVGGAGTGLLVIGAWLAALETRGRLKESTPDQPMPGTRGLSPADIGAALGGVVEKLRTVRGTIAVLVVGAVLLLAALWASACVANHDAKSDDAETTESSAPSSTEPSVTSSTGPSATSSTAVTATDPARPSPTAP